MVGLVHKFVGGGRIWDGVNCQWTFCVKEVRCWVSLTVAFGVSESEMLWMEVEDGWFSSQSVAKHD